MKVDKEGAAFTYRLNRKKLKQVRRREGRYLLRTNLTETDPVKLWNYYLQLVQVAYSGRSCSRFPAHRERRFQQDVNGIPAGT